MADVIEDFYTREAIYKAWIICGDDDESRELARTMDARNHTVSVITMDDVEDERLRFIHRIEYFETGARILITSYSVWAAIKEYILTRVLPEQNLIVFGNLPEEVIRYIERWLQEAMATGFINRNRENFILELYDEGEEEDEGDSGREDEEDEDEDGSDDGNGRKIEDRAHEDDELPTSDAESST